MKLSLPRSAYNAITFVGAIVSVVGTGLFLFLLAISSWIDIGGPYTGLVIFLLLPIPIILGLLLIPTGMYLKSRKGMETEGLGFRVLDLNKPSHRNATFIFIVGTVIFIFLSSFGSYNAYHYTESVQFCGQTCHSVMEPEYTAYKNSPHARVRCVDCHVGAGAGWYVQSKLSGSYQMYAVLADVFPRPIPTPIESLRPARETCEECHWPEKFIDTQQRTIERYLADETNSKWTIHMELAIGGGAEQPKALSGSHWHVHPDNIVEYIAADDQRQTIPWVRWTNKSSGKSVVYNSTTEPLEGNPEDYEIRTMECIDCHNRPSHVYRSPSESIDISIAAGRISSAIPFIKMKGIEALTGEYETRDEALGKISEYITSYYQSDYAEFYGSNTGTVAAAVSEIQDIYSKNFFPYMKVQWKAYPNNIGHLEFPGCYRCHDGKHESQESDPISHSCEGCHRIMAQGFGADTTKTLSLDPLEFEHPVDIGDAWRETGCHDCHTGEIP